MAIYGSLGEVNVGALSATIADTAVDVFVYDTRKDSDGGQWRKRTQHTSWYNETLNTATRGSRRDFPAVAVLVLETGKLTIYDGDDPDMPMWMIFNTTDGSMLRSGVMTSIVMMNGEFWVGHDSGSGLHWVNFLKDTARWLTASTAYGGFFKKGSIIFRNDAGANYDNNIGGASDIIIAGSNILDVAMTVLPNAPIDSATGLPVPTIACLVGETQVTLENGKTKRIDKIKPGEFVKTLEGNHEVLNWFDQGIKETIELEFDNGTKLICTSDHKIRTTDGWVEAGNLTEEHEIISL